MYKKCWLNSAFFQNRAVTIVFPSSLACLTGDLDRNITRMSLDSTVCFLFFGTEVYKLEIFKNFPF